MRTDRTCLLALLVFLAAASAAQTQQANPHIGYIYPPGGQQGATFQALLGGKDLDGAAVALVSGGGVAAKVLEHIRPLNQGAFKEIQRQMGDLMKKKEAAAPAGWTRGGRGGSQTFANAAWTAADEKELADLREKLSTFFIRRTSAPALVETVLLKVSVARDAEPGERELRLQTGHGLTNPLVFKVGQLPEFTEESERSAAEAESQRRGGKGKRSQREDKPIPGASPVSDEPAREVAVTLPVTLNGQILPGDVDRYRFRARKGQQLVAQVSARSLIPYLSDAVPGWFQAAVTLFDAGEEEVAYDDDFRFHPDPVLHCQIPRDGEYVVEIRDALYRGREDFVYRVALGELPYVTGVFPLGSRVGAESTVELAGWNLPIAKLARTEQMSGVDSISVGNGAFLSNRVPFAVDELPECLEKEPNNEPTSAQRVCLPLIVNGRIERPGDMDVFCFEGHAGQQIVAEVKARRLDSSLDSALKLTDTTGKQLAFNDDYEDKAAGLTTHQADSRLGVTLPANGLYRLHLVDQQQKGGGDYGYRLQLRAPQPDFELRVTPSSINVRAGATVPFTAHVLRRDGFSGEIALALKDPPSGFTLSGGHVPTGLDVMRVTLTAPAKPADKSYAVSLVGEATIQARQVVRSAVPADDVMQAFLYRHLVPAKELWVTVTGSPSVLPMEVLSKEPVRIPLGGEARVAVSVPVKSFFGMTKLELDDPPAGITMDDISLNPQYNEIVLRSDAAVAKAGLKGNLIVNVFAAKTEGSSGKGKAQRKKTRILFSALPAIPYEIVGP